jgi:hypothetical protein
VRGNGGTSEFFVTPKLDGVGGELHNPAGFPFGKETPILTEYETTPHKEIRTFLLRKYSYVFLFQKQNKVVLARKSVFKFLFDTKFIKLDSEDGALSFPQILFVIFVCYIIKCLATV